MELHDALRRLSAEGGDHNRLVLEGGRGWFVVHGARHVPDLEVEAAASHYLDEPLPMAAVARLRQAGFASRPRRRTLSRRGVPEDLAAELPVLLSQVYGGETWTASMVLGDREDTRNPVLLEAIKVLAKKRDMPSRHQVYRRVMDATFLYVEDGPFGELSGYRVAGVFTDWDALAYHDPRGMAYRKATGREIIRELVEQPDIGSLRINPDGQIGGELYRNELQTIRAAMKR